MQIYGLFGPSGSGKSYMAQYIAEEVDADWIIDDGLLIWHGHIIAGESAKFEKTKMAAVKRAIFTDPAHKAQVSQALSRLPRESRLLIIGTSKKMIRIICENLELDGANVTFIPIEEMIGAEEINLAQNLRQYGMHAIPINETKIEETPMGRLLARIRFHRDRWLESEKVQASPAKTEHHSGRGRTEQGASKRGVPVELQGSLARTIVNPPFAGGAIHIHPRAIRDSILYLLAEQDYPVQVEKVTVDIGDIPSVQLRLKTKMGYPIQEVAPKILDALRTYFSNCLGLSLVHIQIAVVGLLLK
ncbi:ATP-binding protein [Alicyclobacillus ferrooxydans]|uniref:ATP-binding protein n=1 Tax=Alicyclobacillus ferrooxydans TaxID=471514 RepID=UPI0006D53490|nr:ATP-binding protein [Alicyclobacillus ferrooxydans]